MRLTTPVFVHEGLIPARYTCNGEDISPPLDFYDVPNHTKSMVLICDDPDAPMGTWDHWVVYNLPTKIPGLLEGVKVLPGEAKEGVNSWGNVGYGGPCPPDKEHRYFFKLYAVDTTLSFNSPPTKTEVEIAMVGHILESAELIGRYDQPR